MNKKEIKAPAFKFEMVDGIYQRVGMFDNIIAKLRRFKLGDVEAFREAANTIETLQARIIELEKEISEHDEQEAGYIKALANHIRSITALQKSIAKKDE